MSPTPPTPGPASELDLLDLDWACNDFAARVAHVVHVIAVSSDGVPVAANDGVPLAHRDQLAATASGLASLLGGAAGFLRHGQPVSNLTHLEGGFLLLMSAATGSLLVLADAQADIRQVSYEMTELINRVGHALIPAARPLLAGPRRPR